MADRNEIDCPRAKSWMTPCIARDGATALADDGVCVGCGGQPGALLANLAERHPPVREATVGIYTPAQQADALTRLVAEYVESKS
jgi:hypothetical protein